MAVKAVQILFPGLTANGKVYNRGEIEPEPNQFLIDAANKKLKQFHRDSNRSYLLAKFVDLEDEEDIELEENQDPIEPKKKKKKNVESEKIDPDNILIDLDLALKKAHELKLMAIKLGMKKTAVLEMGLLQLQKLVTFLRIIDKHNKE